MPPFGVVKREIFVHNLVVSLRFRSSGKLSYSYVNEGRGQVMAIGSIPNSVECVGAAHIPNPLDKFELGNPQIG